MKLERFFLDDFLAPVLAKAESMCRQKGIAFKVSKKDLPLEL